MSSKKPSFQDGRSLHYKCESDIIRSYLESLDCPRALSVWLCYKHDHSALLTLDCRACDYPTDQSFADAYKATAFLSKFEGLTLPLDKREEALKSFLDAEIRCFQTNNFFRSDWRRANARAAHVLDVASVKIANLIGEVSSQSLGSILSGCGFGPGVTTSLKGKWLTPTEKLVDDKVTPLLDMALSVITDRDYPSYPAIHNRSTEIGNHILTVPKNAKTDRTIAVEPAINLFFQKGVGAFIRDRLKRVGIDLQDQSRNRELARRGSINYDLATVDLSAASDSLSIEAVRLLLPRSWVRLLEVLRSPNYKLDDRWFRYEKHSSMGNGYTFELESLIFYAVASASTIISGGGTVSVYGDDIIVPCHAYALLKETLEVLGFRVNDTKSFHDGPFRESCGGHYINGLECTPFYYKKKASAKQAIVLANWCRPRGLHRCWMTCYRSVDKRFANFGPTEGPGIHFHWDDYVLGTVEFRYRHGRRLATYVSMVWVADTDPNISLGHALLSSDARSSPSRVISSDDRYLIEPVQKTARGGGRWQRRRCEVEITSLLPPSNFSP